MARKGLPSKYLKAAWKTPGATKKNALKRAWAAFRKARGKSRSSSTSKSKTRKSSSRSSKSGGGRVARGKSLYRSVVKLMKVGALVAPGAIRAMEPGCTSVKLRRVLETYTGIHAHTGKWEPHLAVRGWGPFVGVCVAEKVIAFVNRLLRSI